MKQILSLFAASLFFFSCEDGGQPLTADDVSSIRYGTSFGHCAGHCVTDLEVSPDMIYYSNYGWQEGVEAVVKTSDFSTREYNDILSLIDQEQFLALDPVIGCPDCADGGAEWIEMKVGDRVKKVTFEYGSDIAGIDLAVEELRAVVESLKK